MLLFAAAVPPIEAREAIVATMRSVGPAGDQLDVTPLLAMHVPITSFGNLSRGEARRLIATLGSAVGEWGPPPRLRFSGSTALEWPGDYCVWAKLGGEVDRFSDIARRVPGVVQRLGLFVDRRSFRPWMPVGSITDHTTAAYLERLVGALDAAEGPEWTLTSISLLQKRWSDDERDAEPFEELERFDLAAAEPVSARRG
jgi:2'-5' RNA ligase